MVHIGDSTSEGLISPDYEPNPANRIPARYADVGVKQSIMKIVGATSVVESLPGTPNAYDMASQVKQGGFNGCWVLALGTNDTADVYVGSNVSRLQRIQKMMNLIGNQPVMWVEVTSLLSSRPLLRAEHGAVEPGPAAGAAAVPQHADLQLARRRAEVLVHQRRHPLHLRSATRTGPRRSPTPWPQAFPAS